MFDIQYAMTPNDLIDASYVGNHGVDILTEGVNYDQLPTQYLSLGNQLLNPVANPFYGHIANSGCGLNQPTVPHGQLLLPYPEFCSVSDSQTPAGFSHYNALELTYTHRFSKGLSLLASYTWSKFIDDTEGTTGWAQTGGDFFRDNYNLALEKSVDANDIPQSLVVSYIYELPVGKGKAVGSNMGAVSNAILGGWQVTGITTIKDGFPLSISTTINNACGSFGCNQRPNVIGNPGINNPSIYEWFNTQAFAQPAAYTFGNAGRYLSYLRAPGLARMGHRNSEMVELCRVCKAAIPCRDVQRVQSCKPIRSESAVRQPGFRNYNRSVPGKRYPDGAEAVLVKPSRLLVLALAVFGVAGAQDTTQATPSFEQLIEAAQQAQRQNDLRSAALRYAEALKLRPNIPELHANLGVLEYQLGNASAAAREFQTALQAKPSLFVPNLFLGIEYLKENNVSAALQYLTRAEHINAGDLEVNLSLGRAYAALNKDSDAIAAYSNALAIQRDNEDGWYGLGTSYLDRAESLAALFAKRYRDSAAFRALTANYFDEQGKYDRAIAEYRAIVASPDVPACSRAWLGFTLLHSGQVSQAEEQFNAALGTHDCRTLARIGLARVDMENSRTAPASAILKQAAGQEPRRVSCQRL